MIALITIKKLKGEDAIVDDIDGYCDEADFDLEEE